ncbi:MULTISPECIES: pitrilysin family protein [Methylocystis]|uniref:Peptidase M16 n=1 Tax=Methylocystis iwaonis TaxID=2885079 RepID=A0ABN6VKC1_9HYPH|nr:MULTISPECIES: pitrilysin family protein [Methylocystis]MBL1255743.1 insulinase family protein [Methylocystis sp. Sn-Cys]MDJ0450035.1 pitrilysin family protein [Methylocystis sp. JR02]BDV35974.1 peptidase M16 [Methylocystis iwaonis]
MTAHAPAVSMASRAEHVQRIVTPGGVTAWLVESYAVPLVALEFSLRGGAAQDPADKPGLATLLAGLLDEGAGPYDARGFHRAVDELAIHLGFGADRDSISGHLQTLAKNTDKAFALLKLALVDAHLAEADVARVRSQLVAELKRDANEPDSMAAKAFREAAFPEHPYGRPARGELSSIESLSRPDLLALQQRLFAKKDLKIAVVGAIDAQTLSEHLDATFGALATENDLADVAPITLAGVGSRQIVTLDIPQTTIRFGRPGVTKRDPDYFATVVANHILGGGSFTARLFREVREKRGMAYSVYSQLNEYDRCPMLIGAAATKNERAGEALRIIEEEVRRFAEEGPTEDELDKAKKYLIGSYALRFDTSTKIASQLVHLQMDGFEPSYLDERNGKIAAVGMEECKRAAKKLFGDGGLLVAMVGRPEGV